MPICYVCKEIHPLNDLKEHFEVSHNFGEENRLYKCAELSCSRFYSTFESFRKHWLKQHSNLDIVVPNMKCNSAGIGLKRKAVPLLYHDVLDTSSQHSPHQSSLNLVEQKDSNVKIRIIDSKKIQAVLENKVLTKTAELYANSCPRSQIQHFIESTKEIVKCGLTAIQEEIHNVHNNSDSSGLLKDMDILFKTFDKTICDLDSDYKRMEVLKKTGCLFSPTEFIVGNNLRTVKSTNGDRAIVSKSSTAILFPLESILKKIFELPNVFDLVFSYKSKLENETTILSNFMQSKLWKRLTKDFKSKLVFPIFLFYDDFEIGNALGSHAGVHKLGGVYISLPCFPPEYQSSLSSMIHALLFHSKDRVKFGNFAVFRLLIDKLKTLETDGIELDLPQGKTSVYFKLGLIIGDNAGLHSLLGFAESFNANYSCRFCTMDKIQRSLATMENDTFRRTAESYNRDLQLKNVSRTGIKENCIFHQLPGFHVTGNLSIDIMHVILEGVCSFDMAAILKYYINEAKIFTLEYLNNSISSHDFGMTNSNIPTEISMKHLNNDSIKMSAAETFTFVLHFGILIGHLIPLDDPVWQVYTILRQILALVTSTRIQVGCSQLLRALVKEHHRLIKTVLGRQLKPKDHMLLHLATVMDECGLLISMWGMRFEAKHKESKEWASSSKSKINTCQTIANRALCKLAHQLYSKTIFNLSVEKGPSQLHILKDLPIVFNSVLSSQVQLRNSVNIYNWIKKNGSLYKPGMILCVGENDGEPRFSLIEYIFIHEDSVHFIVSDLTTIFNSHIYGYEVSSVCTTCNIISYVSLLSSHPLSIVKKLINNVEFSYIIFRSYL